MVAAKVLMMDLRLGEMKVVSLALKKALQVVAQKGEKSVD